MTTKETPLLSAPPTKEIVVEANKIFQKEEVMTDLASLDWLVNIRINCLSLEGLVSSVQQQQRISMAGFNTITPAQKNHTSSPTSSSPSSSTTSISSPPALKKLGGEKKSTEGLIVDVLKANASARPHGMTSLQIVKCIASQHPSMTKKERQAIKTSVRHELVRSSLFSRASKGDKLGSPSSNICWTLVEGGRMTSTSSNLIAASGRMERKLRRNISKNNNKGGTNNTTTETNNNTNNNNNNNNKGKSTAITAVKSIIVRDRSSSSSGVSSDSDAESTTESMADKDDAEFFDGFDFLDINTHVGNGEVFGSSLFIHELPQSPVKSFSPSSSFKYNNTNSTKSTINKSNSNNATFDIYGSTNADSWLDSCEMDDPFSIFTQELDAQQHILGDEGLYIMPPASHMHDDLTVYGQGLDTSFNGTLNVSSQHDIDILSF
eukprot:m.16546 g.16546  ORF g.16546 m.16546 type:complete len:435 (-) comp4639_c0_seq1:389-1693(-)